MPDTPSAIRVLHVEDSPRDAELIREIVEADGLECDIIHVDGRTSFENALETGTFNLVLVDFNLPDLDGVTALRFSRQRLPNVPVIVVSGAMDPGEAVRCLKEGATDYLFKQQLERLPSAVKRALDEAEEIRQRQAAEARLLESEERFRQLAEGSREGFWFVAVDPERVLYVNPAMETICGLSADTFYHEPRAWLGAVHPEDRVRVQRAWEAWATGHAPRFEEECRIVRPDGSVRWVSNSGTRIRGDAGTITRLSGLTQDVTERRDLEAQFNQSQKMESVGRLAGGVAHDFNNLITVINGTAALMLRGLADGDPRRADLVEIRKAGEQATALTRQLLAFSRKQILQPRVLNVARIVADTESLLHRLIGEDIDLVVRLEPGIKNVKADPSQLEQVLVNLAVNARDAMPKGGTLIVETRNVELHQGAGSSGIVVPPGHYVMLSVSDTGVGMDDAIRKRVFEPFFTTKGPDQGTGLGLSTVHGIVAQSGGAIAVESEVGRGTTFKVYLPPVAEAAVEPLAKPGVASLSGTETILLVEDNSALRRLAKRMLDAAGYTVLEAANGAEALRRLDDHDTPIHLLLTDVVMPGMNGNELATLARAIRPGIKVLCTTGYTDDALVRSGVLDQEIALVRKPYSAEELTHEVRLVLDSQAELNLRPLGAP